jgi:hypothetical protein
MLRAAGCMFDRNQWLIISCGNRLPILGSRLGDAEKDNFLIRMINQHRLDNSTLRSLSQAFRVDDRIKWS